MKFKNKYFFFFLIGIITLSNCKLPNFSLKPGGKNNTEIPGNSIQVDFFENQSSLASSSASITLTEKIKDVILVQSKKELVSEKGDWLINGVITQYIVNPISIQAGTDNAQQNRLTMTVSVTCVLNDEIMKDGVLQKRDSLVIDPTSRDGAFNAYVDFDATKSFSAIEDELLTELVRQLSQDIYDRIFGGKW